MTRLLVAAFYRFVALPDAAALCAPVREAATAHGVTGSLLLAPEGVNATVAGAPGPLRAFLAWLAQDPRFAGLTVKESWATALPFGRLKVRLKREIVSMGAPGLVGRGPAAEDVDPADWNAVLDDPETVVIDVRNRYETSIGGFEGALDPATETFRDFPRWAAEAPALRRRPPLAIYCTGGIRCEKAGAHLRAAGFEQVRQLKGGVLGYLAATAAANRWRGACFVFDERVALDAALAPSGHRLCRGCRRPLSDADRARPEFVDGVSCHWCAAGLSPAQRRRRTERQRQLLLAAARAAGREASSEPTAPEAGGQAAALSALASVDSTKSAT